MYIVKKDILSLAQLSKADIDHLLERAIELKKRQKQGILDQPLLGKSAGLLFEKHSTRTRFSFEAAMIQLGGTSLYINTQDTQMARKEPVKDTARVLARYLDALIIRTYSQALIEEFAQYADIPVINALSDQCHPCQVLSDILTVVEAKGGYTGLKIAWFGDGNNVAHSWINAAAVLGLELILACPEGYFPKSEILETAQAKNPGKITLTSDPVQAATDADVLYTDVWASMGQEAEVESRKKRFMPYQVNAQLVSRAKADAIVMHCLPVHREEEMSEQVLEGSQSVVWDQSENKMHLHKAVLEALIR